MSQGLLIKELPHSERPRERLMEKGADALKHSELIAILLRTGTKEVSAIQVAEQVLQAVLAERFWVLTHPKTKRAVEKRMQGIVEGKSPEFDPTQM